MAWICFVMALTSPAFEGAAFSVSQAFTAKVHLSRVSFVSTPVTTCVEIKILRRVRAESSRRPPRHRRDACSTAWRCRFLAARPSQDGRVIAEMT